MSAKDYEVIAAAIKAARSTADADQATIDLVANKVGDALAANHRGAYSFKWSRWNEATGVSK
jgi:hypothetical protein